jgi:DNA-binding NarL/FixJ family response regulator
VNLRILIVDDHQLLRQGLKSLLEDEPGLEVVGEAEDGHECVLLVKRLKPDVVVMDVGMPGLNGMDATRQVLADHPEIKVLALSMHTDRRFASGMLQAGASGYLLKDAAYDELIRAIRTVMEGKTYLSPAITEVVVDDYVQRLAGGEGSAGGAFAVLSAREREVLQAMAEGRSTKEIAADLHLSVKTVESHRMQIMNKLDIHSVAELTKYAVREGLTSLEP